MTYDGILLASDGGEAATAAAGHAIALADAFDATLHVVYVLDPGEHPAVHDPGEHPDVKALRERALRTPVERAKEAGVDATAVALRGPTATAICNYGEERGVDLVVMGTHGRTGIGRLLGGSVAERVVRNAPVPVVTVKADAPRPRPGPVPADPDAAEPPSDEASRELRRSLEGFSDDDLQAVIHRAQDVLHDRHAPTSDLEPREGEEIVRIDDHGAYTSVVVRRPDETGVARGPFLYHVRYEPSVDEGSGGYEWHYLGRAADVEDD